MSCVLRSVSGIRCPFFVAKACPALAGHLRPPSHSEHVAQRPVHRKRHPLHTSAAVATLLAASPGDPPTSDRNKIGTGNCVRLSVVCQELSYGYICLHGRQLLGAGWAHAACSLRAVLVYRPAKRHDAMCAVEVCISWDSWAGDCYWRYGFRRWAVFCPVT